MTNPYSGSISPQQAPSTVVSRLDVLEAGLLALQYLLALSENEVNQVANIDSSLFTPSVWAFLAGLAIDDYYTEDEVDALLADYYTEDEVDALLADKSDTTHDHDSDYAATGSTVNLTGVQTVAGVKTFSDSPIVPAPTTDYQAAPKIYVDDNLGFGLFRNAIINGNGRVHQRAATYDYSAGLSQYEVIDRFSVSIVGTAVLRHTPIAAGGQRLEVITADTSIAAGDLSFLMYRVEGIDYAMMSGTLALQFQVKSNIAGTFSVVLKNNASDRSFVSTFATTAGEWVDVLIPFTPDTSGTWLTGEGQNGLTIAITMSCGSAYQTATLDEWQAGNYVAATTQCNLTDTASNYIEIREMQLHEGNILLPYQERSYGDELRLCHRYFWKGQLHGEGYGFMYGPASGSSYYGGAATFPVAMCKAPTITLDPGTATYDNCSLVHYRSSKISMLLRVNTVSLGGYRVFGGVYNADAEI